MEIILTFEGRIPAQRSDMGLIWEMRSAFSEQLRKVWGKAPFDVLKRWEDTNFSAGAPKFIRSTGGHTFVPIYARSVGVGVDLDITLLTGMPDQKPVLSAGDLDNRIKRIIDGLRIPKGHGELLAELPPAGRWYCLLEDDDAVLSLQARLGAYLGSDDPSVSFAVIRVRPHAIAVTQSNLAMLF
ncbi:hypothetical protein [Devosia aquimaris]|uniref:hypothetical protein n=1 Tax=Devosia aquimaris TaxID=2866214 RepID=UPI001CD0BE4F|nr:hypothetical protein [Devosia sp. CJK-A8-3]